MLPCKHQNIPILMSAGSIARSTAADRWNDMSAEMLLAVLLRPVSQHILVSGLHIGVLFLGRLENGYFVRYCHVIHSP